jgi:hypothetical protein
MKKLDYAIFNINHENGENRVHVRKFFHFLFVRLYRSGFNKNRLSYFIYICWRNGGCAGNIFH